MMNCVTKAAFSTAILALPIAVSAAQAQGPESVIVALDSLKMGASPAGPGVSFATLAGNPAEAGSMYAFYVKFAAGAKSLAHTHPDQRIMTVLSGTYYAGTGPEFDESKAKAVKQGGIVIVPARSMHWGWAKDGDVFLQEVGVGPTSTLMSPPGASK